LEEYHEVKPELEMGSPDMRVGSDIQVVLGLKKWCGSARRGGAAVRDLRLVMRTAAPDEAAERTQRDREERETACKERENGKKQRQRAEREREWEERE
jgi:Sec-independent protein translocase protein TatA